MKITPQSLIITSAVGVIAVIGFWYFGAYSNNALSSQSINTEEGIDPRPAIESLDGIAS